MKIGAMELIVIFIVALLVIGPDKLPSYAKKFGNALREFKRASADMTQDIRESVVEPLEEAQRPLREAMEPLEDLKKDVEGSIKGVEKDLKNIGKQKPKETGKDSDAAADEPVPTEDSFGDASVKVPENDSPVSGKEPDTAPVSTQPQPQESGSQPADPAASADSINNV